MMEKVMLSSLFLLATAMLCMCENVAEESLLKKLLNDQSKDSIRDIVDELLLERDNPTLESLLSNEVQQIPAEKRVFCNGAVGCRNRWRRTKPEVEVKKRPFCNGFFGCGNGKRSYNVPVIQDEPEKRQQKRLFCNVTGCGNMGKRTILSALLGRLQPMSEEKIINV